MKYINMAKKFAQEKREKLVAAGVVSAMALPASAAGIEDIGTTAATEIAKFAIAISAVGAAVLSVVVLITGFRMVFSMVRTARG